jgi:hypothetical protein
MRLLSPDELQQVLPAETRAFRGPVPTQIVSTGAPSSAPRRAWRRPTWP